MERIVFSTADAPGCTLEYWADEVLPRYGSRLLSASAKEISCSVVARRTKGIGLGHAVLSCYRGSWQEDAWSVAGSQSLRFYHVSDGVLSVKIKGLEELHLCPGETLVVGPEVTAEFSVLATNESTAHFVEDIAAVPLRRLEEYRKFIPRNLGRKLPASAAGRIVSTFVRALCSDHTTDAEFVILANSFTQLVAATLSGAGHDIASQSEEDKYHRALAFIRKFHREADLTVEKIARVIGVSERVLFDIFHRHDSSPHKYLNRVRIETAKGLLCGSDDKRTMLDIALKCGVESISTFNRQFRSHTGVAPSDYPLSVDNGKT